MESDNVWLSALGDIWHDGWMNEQTDKTGSLIFHNVSLVGDNYDNYTHTFRVGWTLI